MAHVSGFERDLLLLLPAAVDISHGSEWRVVRLKGDAARRYPMQPKFPFVPGYDVVGTVLTVGPGGEPRWVFRNMTRRPEDDRFGTRAERLAPKDH